MPKNRHGFTLMEILVSLTIFMTASLAVTDIFILSTRAQRRGSAIQKVESDARIIINSIADQIRTGGIDYASAVYAAGIPSPADILALRDADNKPILFRVSADACPTVDSRPCLQTSRDNATWNNVTSRDVKVSYLKFYISPLTDPFSAAGNPPNIQPFVTMALGLERARPISATDSPSPFFIQTTVSSRGYKR